MTRFTLPERCDRAATEALLPDLVEALGAGAAEIDASPVRQVSLALLQVLSSARNRSGDTAAGDAQAEAVDLPAAEPDLAEQPSTAPDDFGLDLDSLLDDIAGPAAAGSSSAKEWHLHLRPHAGSMRNGAEPLGLLRELSAMGARCIACDLSHLPELDRLDPVQGWLGFSFAVSDSVTEGDVADLFDFVRDDWGMANGAEAAIPPVQIEERTPASPPPPVLQPAVAASAADTLDAPAPAAASVAQGAASGGAAVAAPAAGQSIRIDLGKLDRLIDTVGELVIAQAMLAQRLSDDGTASEELLLIEGLTRDIQESAMSIRAQPISSVFSRVPRILRELAASTGKHVKLEVVGEGTELDKTVIERLGEPLTHLIRNAVDHGIEGAEERLAAGKPAEGTLTLAAEQRSGRILIHITDDGKGIDRSRVLAKAVEKGIVAAEAQLSPEDIDQLIFAPGFSTAATITSVSGRGVGMDVVRQNVKDLGGRITIESVPGKGTTFTLALPLTLAISDGMIVTVGDQTLVVPLTHVVESLRPGEGDVQGMGTGRQMLNVRGKFIPVLSVAAQTGGRGAGTDPRSGVLIVVDTQVAGQAALLVDTICDQRQFVIKSLEANFRPVEGVAGATILGDGQVALILDVDGLVAGALGHSGLREAA